MINFLRDPISVRLKLTHGDRQTPLSNAAAISERQSILKFFDDSSRSGSWLISVQDDVNRSLSKGKLVDCQKSGHSMNARQESEGTGTAR
jgi:hypothetical protein